MRTFCCMLLGAALMVEGSPSRASLPRYWQCAIELNPYRPKTRVRDFKALLEMTPATAFKRQKIEAPGVLTLKISAGSFEEIVSGEKNAEFLELTPATNELLRKAIERRKRFLRLRFQNHHIQALAIIEQIDLVPADESAGSRLLWRVQLSHATLIWDHQFSYR